MLTGFVKIHAGAGELQDSQHARLQVAKDGGVSDISLGHIGLASGLDSIQC